MTTYSHKKVAVHPGAQKPLCVPPQKHAVRLAPLTAPSEPRRPVLSISLETLPLPPRFATHTQKTDESDVIMKKSQKKKNLSSKPKQKQCKVPCTSSPRGFSGQLPALVSRAFLGVKPLCPPEGVTTRCSTSAPALPLLIYNPRPRSISPSFRPRLQKTSLTNFTI